MRAQGFKISHQLLGRGAPQIIAQKLLFALGSQNGAFVKAVITREPDSGRLQRLVTGRIVQPKLQLENKQVFAHLGATEIGRASCRERVEVMASEGTVIEERLRPV